MKNILFLSILIFAGTGLLCCLACRNKPSGQQQTIARPASQPDSIRLIDQSIHYVKLAFPYQTTDEKGGKKQYTTAWLVRFRLENMPRAMGASMDFFIGDYQIPEYGGWENGIYFKIYDPALLEQLQGQAISIRTTSEQKSTPTRQLFRKIDAPDKLPLEEENKVLGRRQ